MKKLIRYIKKLFNVEPQFDFAFAGGIVMSSEELDQFDNDHLMFKKGGTVEVPTYTPPPAAPAAAEAATQEEAVTPEEEMKRKKEALKAGTKSLQIPVTDTTASSGSVGTPTA